MFILSVLIKINVKELLFFLEELIFEGYGPNGVAILVETMTDNRNRTVADVRHAFTKFGGNLGTDGSVAYLFNMMSSNILVF